VSTRGDLGFVEDGQEYYCYMHYDSFPDDVIQHLINFLGKHGYDEYVKQLKTKGIRGGIRSLIAANTDDDLAEWFMDREPEGDWKEELYAKPENNYSYLVYKDCSIKVMDAADTLIGIIKPNKIIKIVFGAKLGDILDLS